MTKNEIVVGARVLVRSPAGRPRRSLPGRVVAVEGYTVRVVGDEGHWSGVYPPSWLFPFGR